MINRDFSRSGKQYIKQNRIVLITLAVIALVALVIGCVFGFNGGTDIKGYNTFSVTLGSDYKANKMTEYTDTINSKLAENDAKLQSVQLTGEGDSTTIVVKYSGEIDDSVRFNVELAQEFSINPDDDMTAHTQVKPSIVNKDYVYAIAGGLIILTLVAVYTAFRYNLACTITAVGSSLLGVALLMALTILLRLTVNSSFLAINIITMLLILGESLVLFDSLEKERANLKDKNDRSTQLNNALKANAFRQKLLYGALFAISLIFVILMPNTIKQASLIAMFATVVSMFVAIYALPFLWCLTITQVSDKIRTKKDKDTKAVPVVTEDVEGELENNYTENQVIEVKEDSGDTTPSNDDNVTIE